MSDTAPQTLVEQAALAGAQLGVGGVVTKTIARAADGSAPQMDLIKPREPRNIRSAVQTTTASTMNKAKDTIRQALANGGREAAAQPAAQPDPDPVVDQDPPSVEIPASLMNAEPPEPVADPVIPDAPPDGGKDPKAAHAWAKIRHDLAEATKAAKAAKVEADAKASEALKMAETLAALQKEKESVASQLEKVNLLESPTFKARFDGKIADVRGELNTTLAQLIEPDQVNPLVDKLLSASPKELGEMLGKVPQWLQPTILTARATIQRTLADKEKAVADWRSTKVALQEQEAKDSRIKLVTELESETAKAVETAVAQNNYMFKRTGDPKWDAQVDQRVSLAKATLAQARSRQDIVDLVVEGVTAKETREQLAKASAEITKLRSQLSNLGVRPASAVVPAGATPPPPPPAAKPAKMRDFVAETMGRLTTNSRR